MMHVMKAIRVSHPGGEFELIEKEIPQPGKNQVLIKVEACGVCHGDVFVKEGLMPGIEYPRTPGHEIVGVVEEIGENVISWSKGQRVGVGWHGGQCFECEPCRSGDFINCVTGTITGISFDGGYAEYMTAPQEALVRVPESLEAAKAAPLLCAGVTTYNALRNSGAQGGDLVVIQGIGGLGHLGIQYAHKLGFKTAAVSRGSDKRDEALSMGADIYIDSNSQNAAEELQKLGGAKIILATSPNSKSITDLFNGLGTNGKMIVVGAGPDPIEVSPLQLIVGKKTLMGWPSGDAKDEEDAVNFSVLHNIETHVETFPLEKVNEAYELMISGKARFRAVLQMN